MVGVLVLVVAVFALRHPGQNSTQAGSTTARPSQVTSAARASSSAAPSPVTTATVSSSAAASTSSVARLPLVVLNNTMTTGLAQQAQQTFVAGGWTVSSIGNLQNNILSTCAYYDPSVPGAQASATALQQQFPQIKRVEPKFDGLPAGPIVVVLTPDYVSG